MKNSQYNTLQGRRQQRKQNVRRYCDAWGTLGWLSGAVAVLSGVASAAAFNIDVSKSVVLHNPDRAGPGGAESHFGYSVALFSSGGQSWAFVGAPRANSSLGVAEPGALYLCPLSQPTPTCFQTRVDPQSNGQSGGQGNEVYQTLRDGAWLGGALDLLDDMVVTCSHRWKNQWRADEDDYFINGACYWASPQDLLTPGGLSEASWIKVLPLVEYNQQRVTDPGSGIVVYYYQLGQAGMSTHILKDNAGFMMGAPGVKQWTGTVAEVRREGGGGIIESRAAAQVLTYERVFTPYPGSHFADYFGYSTASGRFWGGEDSYVAGAPRAGADLRGKVYVYKSHLSSMVMQWVTEGPQFGCGFGSAIAAGDVNGDGRSELLVGAPLYSSRWSSKGGNSRTPEAGLVLVYTPGASGGLTALTSLTGAPVSPFARFGAAITVLGDLDWDGFQDVAVGAPHEDDGKGAVYIFRGSGNGLLSQPSQKISAADVYTGLRGFGASLSRGVDVDSNSYVDVGVGAWVGQGGGAVLRTRQVARAFLSVDSEVAVLTDPGVEFTVRVCPKYEGHAVMQTLEITVEGVIDGGMAEARAVFLSSGTSHVQSQYMLHNSQHTCFPYTLKLQDTRIGLTEPLEIEFEFSSMELVSAGEMSSCAACAVLAPESSLQGRLSVPMALGCGSDGVCTPRLSLSLAWATGLSDGMYTVGSQADLTLRLVLGAEQEPAYMGQVQVTLPAALSVKSFPYGCDITNKRLVTCQLTNPLFLREEVLDIVVVEEEGAVLGQEGTQLEVQVSVAAAGASNLSSSLPLPLHFDVLMEVHGYTKEEFFYYNASSSSPQSTAATYYQVTNRGLTSVGQAIVEVLVPLAFTSTDGTTTTFGTIQHLQVTPDVGVNRCNYDPTRDLVTGGEVPDTAVTPLEGLPGVQCGEAGVGCGTVTCTLTQLQDGPTIVLHTLFSLSAPVEKYGKNATLSVHSLASVVSPQPPSASGGVWAVFVPLGWQPPPPPAPSVPAWVYVVGVLVGGIILALLVLGLYKLGFFKRKRAGQEAGGKDVETRGPGEEGADSPLAPEDSQAQELSQERDS